MSRCCGATLFTTRSPIKIRPLETRSSPASIRSAVLFPQPDGPTSTMNSPSAISSSRSLTARVSPNFFVTCSKVTLATRSGLPGWILRQGEMRRHEERVGDRERQERQDRRCDAGDVHEQQRERETDEAERSAGDQEGRIARHLPQCPSRLVDGKRPERKLEDRNK